MLFYFIGLYAEKLCIQIVTLEQEDGYISGSLHCETEITFKNFTLRIPRTSLVDDCVYMQISFKILLMAFSWCGCFFVNLTFSLRRLSAL